MTVTVRHISRIGCAATGGFLSWQKLIRRKGEEMKTSAASTEDYDLWFCLARHYSFGYIDIPLMYYLLSAHLAANFREFQNHLLRAGSTPVGPCFPQDFSRISAQTRVIALDTIASYCA